MVDIDNLYIGFCDSALYCQGSSDETTGGMLNSWNWRGYKADNNVSAIILGDRAAGHLFTNFNLQPRNAGQQESGKYPSVDISSMYNVIDGMAWDLWLDSTFVFRNGTAHNRMTGMGWDDVLRFVKDYNPKMYINNKIGDHPLFNPLRPHYGNYNFLGRRIGMYDLPNAAYIWADSVQKPRAMLDIVQARSGGYIPAIFEVYSSVDGTGNIENLNETTTNFIIRSQSAHTTGNIRKGF